MSTPNGDDEKNGSSPRRRGTRFCFSFSSVGSRFIPAQAGNTPVSRSFPVLWAVHPRAGGEHADNHQLYAGLVGSSPRRRGTRLVSVLFHSFIRFIPAQAGNTSFRPPHIEILTVHPRAGGEHTANTPRQKPLLGSSPRRRGTRRRGNDSHDPERFIPAQAGNTCVLSFPHGQTRVHPRAGGEHERWESEMKVSAGSSPRRRGTLDTGTQTWTAVRFIPAQAGNTWSLCPVQHQPSVHPRAGGEHATYHMADLVDAGSSPRRRGTLFVEATDLKRFLRYQRSYQLKTGFQAGFSGWKLTSFRPSKSTGIRRLRPKVRKS